MPAPSMNAEWIEKHFECLGPSTQISLEMIVDQIELGLRIIAPTDARPCYTLFTTGMSSKPMCMPADLDNPAEWHRAELMICLPQGWFGDGDLLEILDANPPERLYWPIRLLKTMAQFPHEYASWLAYGQTFPNEDPPKSYADDTNLSGCLVLWPLTTPRDFRHCHAADGSKIQIYSLIPLFAEELALDLDGPGGLLGLFDQHQVSEVLNPERHNLAQTR